jgi:hypothetical protein
VALMLRFVFFGLIFLTSSHAGVTSVCAERVARFTLQDRHLLITLSVDPDTLTIKDFYFAYDPPANPLSPIRLRFGGKAIVLTQEDLKPEVFNHGTSVGIRANAFAEGYLRLFPLDLEHLRELPFDEILVTWQGGVLVRGGTRGSDRQLRWRNRIPVAYGEGFAERKGDWNFYPAHLQFYESPVPIPDTLRKARNKKRVIRDQGHDYFRHQGAKSVGFEWEQPGISAQLIVDPRKESLSLTESIDYDPLLRTVAIDYDPSKASPGWRTILGAQEIHLSSRDVTGFRWDRSANARQVLVGVTIPPEYLELRFSGFSGCVLVHRRTGRFLMVPIVNRQLMPPSYALFYDSPFFSYLALSDFPSTLWAELYRHRRYFEDPEAQKRQGIWHQTVFGSLLRNRGQWNATQLFEGEAVESQQSSNEPDSVSRMLSD